MILEKYIYGLLYSDNRQYQCGSYTIQYDNEIEFILPKDPLNRMYVYMYKEK